MAARSSHQLPTPLHKWASLRTELLWVYAGVVAPDNRRVTTDHRYGYWAWLLREGEVTVKMEGQTWKARRGQWMISPHGLTVQQFSDDARILSVHFLCQWPMRENLFSGREAVIFDAAQYPYLERSGFALQRLAHRHFPRIRIDLTVQAIGLPVFLRFQQLFLKWLMDFHRVMVERGKFLSQEGDCDERLLRASQCLHQTPLDGPFPEQILRAETGLGRAHLDRLYWKAFGVTTRVYWERLREESAVRSLEATRQPIKEIGYQLGFKQASHFTKWFHQRLNVTPKEYREAALARRKSGAI